MKSDSPMKPDWNKGDVIALPQNLCVTGAVSDGCWVGVAEHEPRLTAAGRWLYGYRDCRELRRATVEDIDRLIKASMHRIALDTSQVDRLNGLRAKIVGCDCGYLGGSY